MKKQLKEKKEYDCKHKNRIRELIVDTVRNKDIESILTLESKDFLFSKLLPEKEIIVWENNSDVYKKMEKNIPKNVDLIFGNIGKFGVIGKNVDMIYLDFTGNWEKEQNEVIRLKQRLEDCKLFAITLCLRNNKYSKTNWKGDYQFDLINKIQNLTEINWKVIYGESYYDSVQMVTLILENENKRINK